METMTIVRRNEFRIMIMVLFLIGSWILTYMFHNHLEIGTVFTHLFYAPIILAALWWGDRGIIVAVIYGLILIVSHVFVRETVETNNDYLRSIIFILVSIFVAKLSETIKHREQALEKQSQDLSERVRELRCLLDLSAFWRNNDKPISEMLQIVVERLPSSFRYPDIACSRIFFKGQAFQTPNFKETRWKLSATLLIQDRPVGLLEVCYLSKQPDLHNGPFLYEEKELIDAIAVWLGDIIENMIARQTRQKITRQMKALSAFRQIKQLITQEKDSEKLASRACAMLTETWGFDYSWICLVNESGIIDHQAESGLGKAFFPLILAIRSGDLPDNVKTALDRPGSVVTTPSGIGNNTTRTTIDANIGTMTIALEYNRKVYGVMSVASPKDLIDDDNEHRLFKELASDIAFALQNSMIAQQQNCIKEDSKGLRAIESFLKQSEERYPFLIKNSPNIIYVLDKNGYFVFIGGALEPLLGYKPAELRGANISSIVWPKDFSTNFWNLRERRTGKRVSKKVELRLKAKQDKRGTGECIIVELNSHGLYENRAYLGTFGVARDITHRKHTNRVSLKEITAQHQMQKQLKQSKLTLQAIFDGLPDCLLMLDKEMNITMINAAAIAHYAIAPDHVADILNLTCYKGLLNQSSHCEHCKIAAAVHQGKQTTFERNDPIFPERYEQVTIFPLKNGYEPDINFLVYIRDITEKKRIEEQLFRADRLSSLGQLSGGIAHEIRDPLSSIQLYVDLLLNPPRNMRTDKDIDYLNEIKDGVVKIDKIIKGILDFAKAPLKPHKKRNINTTIKAVLKLWTPIIKESGINLELSLHHPIEPILGESVQLNQIINNLLSNAIAAMAPEDTLSISTTMGPSKMIPGRTVVFIRIEDTGCGIAEENRTNIFNPFFTTKPTGTGLGLAITHKIVERHGGIITIDSTPGQGTAVVIELPLATRRPASKPSLLSEDRGN